MTSPEIRDWIETGAAVVQALAVPLTGLFAFLSLNQWRRQRRAEQDAELAEEIEIALTRLLKSVARVRSPFGYGGEGSTRERASDETPEQKERLDNAFVHLERYRKESEVFEKLDELEIRANVRFRKQLASEFTELRKHLTTLVLAARSIYRDALRPDLHRNRASTELAAERVERNDKIVWSESEPDRPDEFDAKLQDIESRITRGLARHRL